MTMMERTWQAEGYRYGFQGQEADDEVFGEDNAINYTFRMYDARIGRFLSIDPLAGKYPYWTPYAFSGNMVIQYRELEGLEPAINGTEQGEYEVAENQESGERYGYTWTGDSWRQGVKEVLMDESLPATASTVKLEEENNKSNFIGGIPLVSPKLRISPKIYEGVHAVTGGNDMQEAVGGLIVGTAVTGIAIGAAFELGVGTLLIRSLTPAASMSGTHRTVMMGADGLNQMMTNGGDWRKIDVIDLLLAGGGFKGGSANILSSAFDFSVADGFSSVFGKKTLESFALEATIGELSGRFGDLITGPGFRL